MRTWRNCHEECDRSKFVPEYSGRPNIKSVVAGLRTLGGDSASGPALYWARLKGQNMATVEGTSTSPTDLHLDASKSSSLYLDSISEVRVNGLFGMMLIRSH